MNKWLDKFLHKVPMSHTDIPDTVKERTHEHLTMSGLSGSYPSIIGKNNSSDSRFMEGMENNDEVLTAEKLAYLVELYEERAAIKQFDGGLAREEAEAEAEAEALRGMAHLFDGQAPLPKLSKDMVQ